MELKLREEREQLQKDIHDNNVRQEKEKQMLERKSAQLRGLLEHATEQTMKRIKSAPNTDKRKLMYDY